MPRSARRNSGSSPMPIAASAAPPPSSRSSTQSARLDDQPAARSAKTAVDRRTAGGDDVLDQQYALARLEDSLEPVRGAVLLGRRARSGTGAVAQRVRRRRAARRRARDRRGGRRAGSTRRALRERPGERARAAPDRSRTGTCRGRRTSACPERSTKSPCRSARSASRRASSSRVTRRGRRPRAPRRRAAAAARPRETPQRATASSRRRSTGRPSRVASAPLAQDHGARGRTDRESHCRQEPTPAIDALPAPAVLGLPAGRRPSRRALRDACQTLAQVVEDQAHDRVHRRRRHDVRAASRTTNTLPSGVETSTCETRPGPDRGEPLGRLPHLGAQAHKPFARGAVRQRGGLERARDAADRRGGDLHRDLFQVVQGFVRVQCPPLVAARGRYHKSPRASRALRAAFPSAIRRPRILPLRWRRPETDAALIGCRSARTCCTGTRSSATSSPTAARTSRRWWPTTRCSRCCRYSPSRSP